MTMHFSYANNGKGNKATKFMLVAGLHVVLGTLFVHGLNTRHISLGSLPEQVLVMIEPETPKQPPTPPDPPQPVQQLAPPEIVVPKVEVEVAPPLDAAPLQATTQLDPSPHPFTPVQTASDATPATNANANAGQIRSAVFADANSCALPDYPASAARNGDTGITTLALLVGADGRVSSARVEQSSGSRVLDRAAVNALSLCRFKPAMNNGVAEAGWARMAYVWKLD
jgi:periplasmic protein TonB